MIFLKNIWWGNRNWKFCGRSGLKVLCKHFGFPGHILEPFPCFPQYQPTLQDMHKIFNIFSFNKLNAKWGQWQVKLWQTVGPAAYFRCKVHKGCSPLSARKFLLFHVLCHHFCVSCTAQAWPSSFTPVWPFQGKLWWSWNFSFTQSIR